jgi:peptide/nickel transport system substrate-binding protein
MTRTKQVLLATAAVTLALTGAVAAQDVPREDTVIFDLDRTIRDPENFNWMTDGTGHPPDARRASDDVGAAFHPELRHG